MRLLSLSILVVTSCATAPSRKEPLPIVEQLPPQTRSQPIVDKLHGVDVADPYRWLEDVKSEEVQAWMAAQDKFARERLHALPTRDALQKRFKELYYVDSISPPTHRGNRYFYGRTHADREKAIHYWKEGENGKERVLLDPNKMSEDGSTSVGMVVPTYDGRRIAYTLKVNNADESTIYVMEVETSKVSTVDVIEGGKYASPSWTPSGDGFYYTYLPSGPNIPVAERPGYAEVRFHKLGTDPKTDPLIHERTGNPQTFIGSWISRDGHWLFTSIQHGWNSSDLYYQRAPGKLDGWKPLAVGLPAQFDVIAWKDIFYITTNDGAPKWRVYRADPAKLERKHWKEIIPEKQDAVIEDVSVIGDHLSVKYMKNASNELSLFSLDGKLVRNIALPTIGMASLHGNPIDDDAYLSFNSFTHPVEIHKTSIKTGQSSLWAKVTLPIDPSPYEVEQVWYPSKDGTRISMFIVRRKDLKKDGSTPLLLGGYGGFNVSMLAQFVSRLYPWLEAGGTYALPNLRGGGEYGEDWHKAGMLDKKQNVFDDYIAAAEYLIANKYTSSDRLAISGGSNGGLLVGAAMTQRPELYRAVVCAVPLLDMVRYHLFGSGKTWIPEYGSAEDAAQFKTLFAYSPYHHVKKGTRYPALLMLGADSDDRVDPMHARKFVAQVQAATASDHPVWLRIEKHAGHGGADLVKQAVEQAADQYAFLMHELGLEKIFIAKGSK